MSKDKQQREGKKAKQTVKSKEQSDYKKADSGAITVPLPFKKAK
jgi:hypothetical protein